MRHFEHADLSAHVYRWLVIENGTRCLAVDYCELTYVTLPDGTKFVLGPFRCGTFGSS